MPVTMDQTASLALGATCVLLLGAHRRFGSRNHYARVTQQGASFFLGTNLMDAGYWLLQPVVRACVRSDTTPATVSWLSTVPALGAAILAATGHWGFAAWCLLASALLDVLDGALARATASCSPAGSVLDSVLDRYAEFAFFAGVFIRYRADLAAQLVTLAALCGSFLISYSTAKAEALRITPPRGMMKRSDRLALLVLASALTPLWQLWLPTRSHFDWPMLAALTVIAVLANASAVQRFIALGRAARPAAPRPEAPLRPASRLRPVPTTPAVRVISGRSDKA